jgi:hypothetical protein
MQTLDYCPKCGEVGTIKTDNYGMFHTITKCSNCDNSDIKNKTLPEEQPVLNIMNQQPYNPPPPGHVPQAAPQPAQPQKTLAPIRLFPAHPNAPDFVLASGVIGLDEFFGFVQGNPHLLSDYQGKAQLKFQILRSKEGKLYTQVDEYKPQTQAPAPAPAQQWGGHAAAPTYQSPPSLMANGWGAQPVQQQAPAQFAAGDLPF